MLSVDSSSFPKVYRSDNIPLPSISISNLFLFISNSLTPTSNPLITCYPTSTPPIPPLDSVVRQSYSQYFHPKEVLITNGILNRSILHSASRLRSQTTTDNSSQTLENYSDELEPKNKLSFLFTYGATINVVREIFSFLPAFCT